MNGNFMLLTVKRLQDVVTVLLLIQRTVECSFLTKTIETAPNQRRLHKKLFCCTSPPGNVYDTLYSLLFCEICHHFLVFTILWTSLDELGQYLAVILSLKVGKEGPCHLQMWWYGWVGTHTPLFAFRLTYRTKSSRERTYVGLMFLKKHLEYCRPWLLSANLVSRSQLSPWVVWKWKKDRSLSARIWGCSVLKVDLANTCLAAAFSLSKSLWVYWSSSYLSLCETAWATTKLVQSARVSFSFISSRFSLKAVNTLNWHKRPQLLLMLHAKRWSVCCTWGNENVCGCITKC